MHWRTAPWDNMRGHLRTQLKGWDARSFTNVNGAIESFYNVVDGAVEKYIKDTTKGEAARNTGTNARTSRATAKGNTPDYKQTRPWTKKTTGPEKLIKKRRERTTKATKNGMELQQWMQTVGEENTELRRPKGIG